MNSTELHDMACFILMYFIKCPLVSGQKQSFSVVQLRAERRMRDLAQLVGLCHCLSG